MDEEVKRIKRKIYFHHISWLNEEKERVYKDKSFLEPIIEKIAVNKDNGEFNEILENHTDKSEDVNKSDDWIFGVIAKTKKADFPRKQNLETFKIEDLDLESNEGLYYPTHFAIYKGEILISELNIETFRVYSFLTRKINEYLETNNVKDIISIQISPILRDDFKELVEDSKLRKVQISIAPDKRDILKSNNSLKEMFGNIETFPDLTLDISFGIGKKRSDKYYEKMDEIKDYILNILDSEDIFNLEKLILTIKNDESIENLDLLNQIFFVKGEFLKINNKSKAIDMEDAFKKFKLIYKENNDELDNHILNGA